ncbi:MAG: hypothetical protein IT201_14555 [Thermoleophilia bacterium]|nr:hypothetical protein [Thermoleophilia bacterium]
MIAHETLCERCRQPIYGGELYVLTATGRQHALCGGAGKAFCPRCVERAVITKRLKAGLFHQCTACGWERFFRRGTF